MSTKEKAMMFVLSSPSGAGKTTLTKKLEKNNNNFKISISHTTRKPRPNEINGKDYYFVNDEEFNNLVKKNDFFEHAKIFDNYYGTLKKPVQALLDSGKDVLFDIDWQGTQQLYQSKPSNLVSIFILPPSKDEIENRLRQRKVDSGDDESIINKRMSKFKDEISHWVEYDYVVINNKLKTCVDEILNIIHVERKKRRRQLNLVNKVRELTS